MHTCEYKFFTSTRVSHDTVSSTGVLLTYRVGVKHDLDVNDYDLRFALALGVDEWGM